MISSRQLSGTDSVLQIAGKCIKIFRGACHRIPPPSGCIFFCLVVLPLCLPVKKKSGLPLVEVQLCLNLSAFCLTHNQSEFLFWFSFFLVCVPHIIRVFSFFILWICRQVKSLEEEVTLVGNNLRSLEVSEGEVSQKFSC